MLKKASVAVYRFVVFNCRLFTPRFKPEGIEKVSSTPAIFVSNHSQMFGPIAAEIHFPFRRYTWCAGEMMHKEEVAAYAYQDFWSQKPKRSRWFYKILAHLITPLAVCIFNNAETLEVYHDARIINTFRRTMECLHDGASIVIFPEKDEHYNHVLYEFQDKFVDVARFYYRKYKVELDFVPYYLAPRLGRMVFGEPIHFHHDVPIEEERARICQAIKDEITDIADSLPPHTIVPYRNIPKKLYPHNHPKGDSK